MYKRRLLISEDEKRYIKGLYGLIQEQKTLPGAKVKIDFGDLYGDGKYLIKNEARFKQKLDSQLLPFVEKNPGVPLNIRVLGGESATTNYDYETNDGKSKEDFYLAKKRRDAMITWLRNYFANSTIEPKPIVDDTPNEENINVFRGRTGNSVQDRFVDVVVAAQAPGTCLIGLKIEVIYENSGKSNKFPCRGGMGKHPKTGAPIFIGHKCDAAVFNVLLNDVVIGEVNLNNLVDGGNRNGTVEVTEAQAIEIASKGGNSVRLSLQCLLPNCHKDVAEIRITNSSGVIYHSCTPVLQSRGAGISDLLRLDKCGTKIVERNTKEVGTSGDVEVKKEFGSEYWDKVAASPSKFIKKLQDGSYEVLTDKLMNPATNEKFKIGDIIPKPSF
jgi:hypothetical protein